MVTLCAVLAGCGDGPTPPAPRPGLTVVAGGGAADTALAPQSRLLTVEIRDETGARVPDAVVQFTGRRDPFDYLEQRVMVCATEATRCEDVGPAGDSVLATTDGNGRASVRLRMGTRAPPPTPQPAGPPRRSTAFSPGARS